METNNVIETKNVHLFYGEKEALKGVSLQIARNEIHAFIGPSGCGKSTLLKTLNRMNDLIPDCKIQGDILVDGEDVYAKKTDVNALRHKVGMVFSLGN